MTLYEKAIGIMAQEVLDFYCLLSTDSNIRYIDIDVDDDDLIYLLDLMEDGRVETPGQQRTKASALISYHDGHDHRPTYVTVIEDHIEKTWADTLDAELAEIVAATIR